MADARELLAEFIVAFEAGDHPIPDVLLERAAAGERQELADLIDRYLMTAPRQAWDPDAYEASLAKVAVEQVYESIEGVSGSWPELLPQLRNRARVKRSELVARLATALGVGESGPQVAKVADYYNRMEHGLLAADGVSGRVIDALAQVVGVGAEAIRAAGEGSSPVSGGEAPAFARRALLDAEYTQSVADELSAPAPPMSPGTAPGHDEIDELFTGG